MIIFDLETTSLTSPDAAPLDFQPHIMELAAIKVDPKTLRVLSKLEFLCKPPISIPPESIKITGITNEMVKDRPPFVAFYAQVVDFFLGERTVVAHNIMFDISCLRYEIRRLGKSTAFPYPPDQICTVERTLYIKGHRLTLGALHLELTGKEHGKATGAHRGMNDVEALHRCVIELRKKKVL